ncbi:MAG: helix-turn-helix domain-containing protein [bacterium]
MRTFLSKNFCPNRQKPHPAFPPPPKAREISQIGKNIKKLRKQKGLSQDRLSKLADISYNTVIKLESGGITNPSIDTLQKLAKALDVSVDKLS